MKNTDEVADSLDDGSPVHQRGHLLDVRAQASSMFHIFSVSFCSFLACIVFRITWPLSSKSAVQLDEEAGRADYLQFVPAFFGLAVANEF